MASAKRYVVDCEGHSKRFGSVTTALVQAYKWARRLNTDAFVSRGSLIIAKVTGY